MCERVTLSNAVDFSFPIGVSKHEGPVDLNLTHWLRRGLESTILSRRAGGRFCPAGMRCAALCCGLVLLAGCGGDKSGDEDRPDPAQEPSPAAVVPAPSRDKTPAAAPAESVVLPADTARFQTLAQLEILEGDAGKLLLRISNAKQAVNVRIPLGTRAVPTTSDKPPTYVVAKDGEFTIDPSRGEKSEHSVDVVMTDVAAWAAGRDTDRWALAEPDASEAGRKLGTFLKAAGAEPDLRWSQIQFGAFVILQDIPAKALHGASLLMKSGFLGMSEVVTRTYSYSAVRRLRTVFESIGEDPDKYQLFRDNQASFEEALQTHTVSGWDQDLDIGHSGNLFNGLGDYRDEPRVHQLLLGYMRNHTDFYHRKEAALYLVKTEALTQESDELYRIATTDQCRMLRFAAARTLQRRDDWRAEPLVAAYGHDWSLVQPFAGAMKKQITKDSGQKPAPAETLLAFWERSGGWERLAAEHDVTDLKQAVARLKEWEDSLIAYLAQSLPPNASDGIYDGLGKWPQRFPLQPRLVAWVWQVVRLNPDKNVRVAAIKALRRFDTFDHFELLIDRLENDPADDVKIAAAATDWSTDPAKCVEFFLRAVVSPNQQVRSRAISRVGEDMFNEQVENALGRVVAQDPVMHLRKSAMTRLARLKAPSALQVIRRALADADPDRLLLASEALSLWISLKRDAEGLALVKEVAARHALPQIRSIAVSRLADYTRLEVPIMDTALDRVINDPVDSVQASAVVLAHRLMERTAEKEQAAQVVRQGLNSRHAKVREAAVKAAAGTKLPGAEPRLVALAGSDPAPKVRTAAYAALERTDSPECVPVLASWLRSDDARTRHEAVKKLTREFAKDSRTPALLAPLKDDPDFSVKRDANRFLSQRR